MVTVGNIARKLGVELKKPWNAAWKEEALHAARDTGYPPGQLDVVHPVRNTVEGVPD